jgi:DNA-binding response OmpR family regulator
MNRRKVLSVGQCDTDDGQLRRALEGRYTIEIVAVDTAEDALRHARQGGYALVLINRVFDVDGGDGVTLIRALKADADLATLPVMLVSNFADAQADAVNAGALPGFGKAALTAALTFEMLDPVLGPAA